MTAAFARQRRRAFCRARRGIRDGDSSACSCSSNRSAIDGRRLTTTAGRNEKPERLTASLDEARDALSVSKDRGRRDRRAHSFSARSGALRGRSLFSWTSRGAVARCGRFRRAASRARRRTGSGGVDSFRALSSSTCRSRSARRFTRTAWPAFAREREAWHRARDKVTRATAPSTPGFCASRPMPEPVSSSSGRFGSAAGLSVRTIRAHRRWRR